MSTKTSAFAYLIPILLLVGLAWLIVTEVHGPSDNDSDVQTHVQLPVFTVPSLWNPNNTFTQTELHGQVSLLIFWGSWCPACRAEQPMLMQIQKKYHVPMYSMILNDDPESAKAWLTQAGNPYVMTGIDTDARLAQALSVVATPEMYIVDKHGMIRFRYIGGMTQKAWEEEIFPLITQYKSET